MGDEGAIRLASVGAGYFAAFHLEAWTRISRVRREAVCDSDPARAADAAARYGYAGAFDDAAAMIEAVRPDLVDIATPPPSHLGLDRAAAAAGAAIVCQKPFCGTLEEAREAVRIAREAGVVLAVHENFRFQPWYREIARQIASGRMGEIYQATFRLRPGDGQGPDAYLDRQPYFRAMERFLVHETAIHFVDVFRFLLGEVADVQARLDRLNPAIAGEDAGLIVFGHAGGRRALFDGNRLASHAAENRRLTMGEMLVEGSAGCLRLDGDGRLWWRAHDENAETRILYPPFGPGFGGDCVHALQAHVVAHLLDGAPLENAGADYLLNLEVERAIYDSATGGTRIRPWPER
ncbi:MAG: Gfo/Idh/MocA family protein [Flavobacteriaceae bacterium]